MLQVIKIRKPTLTGTLIILNACWFLIGLLWLGWSAETIVFAYIFETIVIGIITLVKMIVLCFAGVKNKAETALTINKSFSGTELTLLQRNKLYKLVFFLYNFFIIGMFTIVFSGFIWGQSIFVFLIASINNADISNAPNQILQNYTYLFSKAEIKEACGGIMLVQIISFIHLFFFNKEYQCSTIQNVFVQPWIRILIQQLIAIAGGVVFFASGYKLVSVAILLILIKTVIDIKRGTMAN